MSILDHYLRKLGFAHSSELNEEEKQTYEEWKKALYGRKLTDDEVSDFLYSLRDKASRKLANISQLSERESIFYSVQLQTALNILDFLELPEREKAQAEMHINSLLNDG